MAKSKRVPKIAWGEAPPATFRGVPKRRILRPKVGQDVNGHVISDKVEGVWVHWLNGHDWPCTGEFASCQGCQANPSSLRWKGYIEVLVSGKVYLVELSEGAYQSCPRLASDASLRGMVIKVRRLDSRPNGRVATEVGEGRFASPLPAAHNVRELLAAVWFGRPRSADELPESEKGEEDESSI